MLLRCESLEPPMSQLGQTLPSRDFCGTSAFPLKPDIGWRGWHGSFVPTTDACTAAKMHAYSITSSARASGVGGTVRTERLGGLKIDDQHEFRRRVTGSFGQITSCLMLGYLIWRRILKN
jgi:hypothetical protein